MLALLVLPIPALQTFLLPTKKNPWGGFLLQLPHSPSSSSHPRFGRIIWEERNPPMSQRAIPSHSCYNPANSSRIPTKNPQITSSQPCNSTALKDTERKVEIPNAPPKKKSPNFSHNALDLKIVAVLGAGSFQGGLKRKGFHGERRMMAKIKVSPSI